jgi:hypothetical protein
MLFFGINVLHAQDEKLSLQKIDETVTIDGQADEAFWSSLDENVIDNPGDTVSANSNSFSWGDPGAFDPPTGPDDFTGSFKAAYNEDGMYLLFTIIDDKYTHGSRTLDTTLCNDGKYCGFSNQAEGFAFDADKIELYFKVGDPSVADNADEGSAVDNGYYQLVTWPADPAIVYFTDAPRVPTFDEFYNWQTDKIQVGFAQTLDGYNVEMFVAWNILEDENDEAFVPENGQNFIFDVSFRDNDNELNEEGALPGNPHSPVLWSDNRNISNRDPETHTYLPMDLGTVTILGEPTGEQLTIHKINTDVTLDGFADESFWANVGANVIDNPGDTVSSHWGSFSWSTFDPPTGPTDFTGEFKSVYDDDGLYLLFTIVDEKITHGSRTLDTTLCNDGKYCGFSNQAEGFAFDADKIELYFKVGDPSVPDNANDNSAIENGYYQLVTWAGEPSIVYFTGAPKVPTFDEFYNWQTDNIQVGFAQTLDGYNIEMFIDWSILTTQDGSPISVVQGTQFIFDVDVRDNDNELDEDGALPGNPHSPVLWSDDRNISNRDPNTRTYEPLSLGVITLGDVITNIRNVELNNQINIYPNPVNTQLYIKSDVDIVKITDILGKEIVSAPVLNQQVNVSQLSEGMYIINLYRDGNLVSTSKFLKY